MNFGTQIKNTSYFGLALIFLLVIVTVSGCAPVKTDSDVIPAVPDDKNSKAEAIGESYLTAEQWLDTLNEADFEGYEFTIVATNEEAFLPEGDGLVQQAVNQRNDWVQSKYNIILKTNLVEEGQYYQTVRNSERSQTYIGDMLSAPFEVLSSLASEKMLYNIFSLPYMNTNAEYVDDKLMKSTTGNNSLFIMVDSISEYNGRQWCVFYDLGLINQLGLTDPVVAVKSGEWTWDMLLIMSGQAATLGDGYSGFLTYFDGEQLANAVWNSAGQKYFGDIYHNQIELRLDFDKSQITLDTMKSVTRSEYLGKLTEDDAISTFSDGNALFFVYQLDMAAVIADNSREWGIVPLPKIDASQTEYCSYLDPATSGIAIPASTQNTERTGMILNAMFAASYEHIDEAVKSSYINFYLRNNSSGLMLKKIFDTTYLDFAFIYGEGMDFISVNTYDLMNDVMKRDLDMIQRFDREKEIKEAIKNEADKIFK